MHYSMINLIICVVFPSHFNMIVLNFHNENNAFFLYSIVYSSHILHSTFSRILDPFLLLSSRRHLITSYAHPPETAQLILRRFRWSAALLYIVWSVYIWYKTSFFSPLYLYIYIYRHISTFINVSFCVRNISSPIYTHYITHLCY